MFNAPYKNEHIIIIIIIIDLTYLGQVKNIILTGDFNADPSTANGRKLASFANVNTFTLHIMNQQELQKGHPVFLINLLQIFLNLLKPRGLIHLY